MRYKKLLIMLLAFAGMQAGAQDLRHYKRVIKELASAKYQGRGYAKGGANKAGMFLKKEYEKAGVDEVILQPFKLDINTFSGKMDVSVILNSQLAQNAPSILNSKKLTPGVDFSMREYSPGIHGEFPVYHVDTLNFDATVCLPTYKSLSMPMPWWLASSGLPIVTGRLSLVYRKQASVPMRVLSIRGRHPSSFSRPTDIVWLKNLSYG